MRSEFYFDYDEIDIDWNSYSGSPAYPTFDVLAKKLPEYATVSEKLLKAFHPTAGFDTGWDFGEPIYADPGDFSPRTARALLTALSTGECTNSQANPESWARLMAVLKEDSDKFHDQKVSESKEP